MISTSSPRGAQRLTLGEAAMRLEEKLGRQPARSAIVSILREGTRLGAEAELLTDRLYPSDGGPVLDAFAPLERTPVPASFWLEAHARPYSAASDGWADRSWADFNKGIVQCVENCRGYSLPYRWQRQITEDRFGDDFERVRVAHGVTLDQGDVEALARDRGLRRYTREDRVWRALGRPRKWPLDHAMAELVAIAARGDLPGVGLDEPGMADAIAKRLQEIIDGLTGDYPERSDRLVEAAKAVASALNRNLDRNSDPEAPFD